MNKKTKETVGTITVIVAAALFIIFYIVYPLTIIPKLTGRANRDIFNDPKFLPTNDPSFFTQKSMRPDTFTVISNDNIGLAALYFSPKASSSNIRGTIILLHPDDTNRTAMERYIEPLIQSGLAVVIYDQRACGYSGGKYRSAGNYESDDLIEVIAELNLHERLLRPLIIVGFGAGGDAALYASKSEKKISAIAAISPYLTTSRWIDKLKERYGAWYIPFYRVVYFWWYQNISGYSFDRTGVNNITPVEIKTVLLADSDLQNSKELKKLMEVSSAGLLTVKAKSVNNQELERYIFDWILSEIR
ncbi:MAG: alpha/beta hydrolase [candidate division Zixibacteria bacterium]|nr:alpha/beta hydrolase [candidate division Zixibacteria bacterium]